MNFEITFKQSLYLVGNFGRSLTNGLDLAASLTKKNYVPDDVIEKYREAIVHYGKVRWKELLRLLWVEVLYKYLLNLWTILFNVHIITIYKRLTLDIKIKDIFFNKNYCILLSVS